MPGATFYEAGNIPPAPQAPELGRVSDGVILDPNNAGQTEHAVSVPLTNPVRASTEGSSWWKARDTFVLLSFVGLTLVYMVRVSLSIAIVAMVSRNETTNESQVSDACPVPDDSPGHTVVVGEFDWSDKTVALVLGAFYYGSTASNFLGGRAAENFGGRLVFGVGVVVPSILSLFSSLCIYASEYVFIALRVLEGVAQGASVPAVHFMIAAWIPTKDKAKYASIIFSGIQAGTVIAMSFGGWLCDTTFLGGWPSVFYVFGGLGVLWGIPWFFLIHNLPEHHPRISASELEYIQTHRHYVNRDKAVAIPWREIATSAPFWATVAVNFFYNFSFYTLLTELPTFFNIILHFNMSKNALGSALPYILQSVVCVAWGFFVDVLHSRNYMTVNGIRKLSTSIGMYLSAVCLIAMLWVKCNAVMAVIMMCLAVGLMGTMNSGSSLSEQDIAPNLAGTLKGLSNTLASSTGFLAPVLTAAITSDNQTVSAWNTVFLISATCNLLFCTVYMIFGTDQVQPWNNPQARGSEH